MRRLVFPVIFASGLVMVGPVPAFAEPAPAVTSAKAAAGKKICKITDPALPELSGIVATENGFVVVNDGADDASRRKIFFLDDECDITKKVDYPSRPLDTEDLVLSADGDTLWIADIGDNNARTKNGETRATIGLWSMPADGSEEPKIHRVAYPDGDKHDAEALLFNGDGTPIIVTKEVTGKTLLYTPTGPLKAGSQKGVPLKRAGEIELPSSDTPGIPIARLAQTTVTGGAVAPGGGRVTLRTYLDAYEWDVADGDVIGALKNKPRKTGLPNEPFGEAITYSADGKLFYTVSDMGTGADPESANYILRYTPATNIVEAKTNAAAAGAGDDTSWYSDLSLTDITYLIGGVGVLGLLLVGAGVFGIVQSRKKRGLEPKAKSTDPTGGPDPLDAKTELLSVGGAPQRPGVYGGNRPPAGAPSGPGVYGAKTGGPAGSPGSSKGSGVYGGAGRPPRGGQPAGRPAPAGPGGQPPARPGGGRPAVPPAGPGGQPARPAQPGGRPGQGGQPRPGQGGQPRPGQGGQPRPGQGGQPGVRPSQPPARPAQPGRQGPGGGGVYGAPPAPPPPTGRPPGGGPQRPSGSPGQGGGPQGRNPQGGRQPGRPDGGRQANGMNNYANVNGVPQRAEGRYDNPGYGRPPRAY
jgi:hypothetical protein